MLKLDQHFVYVKSYVIIVTTSNGHYNRWKVKWISKCRIIRWNHWQAVVVEKLLYIYSFSYSTTLQYVHWQQFTWWRKLEWLYSWFLLPCLVGSISQCQSTTFDAAIVGYSISRWKGVLSFPSMKDSFCISPKVPFCILFLPKIVGL